MKHHELGNFLSQVTGGAKLIIVSNREPFIHERVSGGIRATRPASGMVTALEPIIRSVGGTWIAHGAGSADRLTVDSAGRVGLPPENPEYALRRVWLTRKEEDGYYYGISNGALWPLCHNVYSRPRFSRKDWEVYKDVNKKFCEAVLEETGGSQAIIFIQDFHLALLPRMLREGRPDLKIIHFWHIPWPNMESFRIFPWAEELLEGLLGNDILGFHIQYHRNNFLDTVEKGIESRVDYEHFRVIKGNSATYVRPFPISVDFEQIGADAQACATESRMTDFRKEIGEGISEMKLYVGADRIDYTKGIPERLKAFDLMLQRHPELKTRVTLVQLAAPSRTHLEAYRDLNDELDDLVDEINWRHQNDEWVPIRFLRAHHDYHSVLAACRLADVALVTSLHDGMNLVAKEFVSSRTDGDGVLLLSRYTGAAREFPDALLVNPYDIDQLSDAMYTAFSLNEEERRQRMTRLRGHLERNTVYKWGMNIFEEADRLLYLKEECNEHFC